MAFALKIPKHINDKINQLTTVARSDFQLDDQDWYIESVQSYNSAMQHTLQYTSATFIQ